MPPAYWAKLRTTRLMILKETSKLQSELPGSVGGVLPRLVVTARTFRCEARSTLLGARLCLDNSRCHIL